jgi:transcription antitermination factor NusG
MLGGKGLETFLPMYSSVSRWSDRVKKLQLPLFAGYVFSQFEATRRLPVLTTPGVVHILGNSSGPVPVDEGELDAVRRLIAAARPLSPWPYLEAGDRIVLEGGPLAGTRGTLLRVKNEFRLIVSVTLLQRSVAVEVDRAAVRRDSSTGGEAFLAVGSAAEF